MNVYIHIGALYENIQYRTRNIVLKKHIVEEMQILCNMI